MGSVAHVQDGKIVDTTKNNAATTTTKKGGNTLDKDAFLGLLVAQMKYQDPLEPTSNTEFISQYATFSELEQMQNMNATMELSRASSMVGKTVSVNATTATGEVVPLQGKVDFVVYENGKAMLSIGGTKYSLDDVIGVADQDYLDAYDLAYELALAVSKLPKIEDITLDDKEAIDKINKSYEGMNDYQKSFVAPDLSKKLKEYTDRIAELAKDKEESKPPETPKDEEKV